MAVDSKRLLIPSAKAMQPRVGVPVHTCLSWHTGHPIHIQMQPSRILPQVCRAAYCHAAPLLNA